MLVYKPPYSGCNEYVSYEQYSLRHLYVTFSLTGTNAVSHNCHTVVKKLVVSHDGFKHVLRVRRPPVCNEQDAPI